MKEIYDKSVAWLTKLFFNIKKICFKLIFFNSNEYVTIAIALSAKKKKSIVWMANNLFIPVLIIYSPYLLTLLSHHFQTLRYEKNFYDLSITGALTLLGINVMRVSLSLIDERINESKIPESILKNVTDDIASIKSKLRLWSIVLTFIGGICYFIQVGNFLNPSQGVIKWYVGAFLLITLFSIFISRIIVVIQSNFVDNDNLIQIWMKLLNYNTEKEYSSLKTITTEEGL